MNVLIDTDILIDVASNREPFFGHSSIVLDKAQTKAFRGFCAWHTFSNFHYLFSSTVDKKSSLAFIEELLLFVKVAPTLTRDAKYALNLQFSDFEDALQVAAAKACNADFIITRNLRHYSKSPIPAKSPKAFLKLL